MTLEPAAMEKGQHNSPPSLSPTIDRRRRFFVVLIFILAGLGVYANTFNYPPVWDDHDFFELNKQIRSMRSIPQYFIHEPQKTHGGVLRPVVYVYYTICYWADHGKPRGIRVFAIICNILSALILVSIVRTALEQLKVGDDSLSRSWFPELAGLIFLVHPIHIEAVTWLSGGGYAVCGMLFLLSFLLFQRGRPFLSLSAFALSLLTTEMAASLPVMVVLYAFLRQRRNAIEDRLSPHTGRAFMIVGPYLLVFALYLLYRYAILGQMTRGIPSFGGSILVTIFSMCKTTLDYLQMLLIPGNLLVDHYFAILGRGQIWYVLLIVEILVFLAAVFIVCGKRAPVIFFFFMWFFITLLPVSNLIPTGGTPKAERYLFIPSAGISAVIALLIGYLAAYRCKFVFSGHSVPLRKYAIAAGITIVALFGMRTSFHNRVWRSEEALWKEVVVQNIINPRAHANYCGTLWGSGDYVKLLSSYRRAQKYTRGFQTEMAMLYLGLGDKEQAERQLRMGVLINPNNKRALMLLGQLLLEQGEIDQAYCYLKGYDGKERDSKFLASLAAASLFKGDTQTYVKAREELITKFPMFTEHSRYLKAYYLSEMGKFEEAVKEWERCISFYDSSYTNLTGYATSLDNAGKHLKAEWILKLVVEKFPDALEVYYNSAYFYTKRQEYAKAISILSSISEFLPDNPGLMNLLAYSYLANGDRERAAKEFTDLAIKYPNYYLAYGNIGCSYQHLGEYARAREFLIKYEFLSSKDPRAYAYLGDLYRSLSFPKLSFHYYLAAAELASKDPETLPVIKKETHAFDDPRVSSFLEEMEKRGDN